MHFIFVRIIRKELSSHWQSTVDAASPLPACWNKLRTSGQSIAMQASWSAIRIRMSALPKHLKFVELNLIFAWTL